MNLQVWLDGGGGGLEDWRHSELAPEGVCDLLRAFARDLLLEVTAHMDERYDYYLKVRHSFADTDQQAQRARAEANGAEVSRQREYVKKLLAELEAEEGG